MRWATTAGALEAAVTSLILLLSPALFGRLIFGAELSEPGQALGRLAGIVLACFALASWPKPGTKPDLAMFFYNLLARLYLSYLGIEGNVSGNTVVASSGSAFAFDSPSRSSPPSCQTGLGIKKSADNDITAPARKSSSEECPRMARPRRTLRLAKARSSLGLAVNLPLPLHPQ